MSLNQSIDTHIILNFLRTAVMGVMESYVLEEIDGDIESVAKQVGKLVKRHI
ncbi:TetR family transcriptional regulator [Bacillus rhizoplanae]|uniref:TetR family transcriptional regulator n=1 Tax=Bacillus rhizoplanae TaxID=2880966 RepID=UPI001E400E2B|nr:TetR family transcriptional regulator [Bacillus rhizoplanae]